MKTAQNEKEARAILKSDKQVCYRGIEIKFGLFPTLGKAKGYYVGKYHAKSISEAIKEAKRIS